MPVLTDNELRDAVFREDVKGIAIDTSIFEQYHFGFEVGLLARLQQFANGPVRHVMVDVIRHEIQRHLKESATVDRAHVKNALKPLTNSWGTPPGRRDEVLERLFADKDGTGIAEERIAAFEQATRALLIDSSDSATLAEVMHLFLNTLPPFGDKEGKKNEFPDAVVLCALEGWSRSQGGLVLAVSRDKDWANFAAEADGVCVVSDLSMALNAFQANSEGLKAALAAAVSGENWHAFETQLLTSLNLEADSIEIDLQASSAYYYEAELVEASLSSAPEAEAQFMNAEIVSLEDGELQISVAIDCAIEARFSVSFSVWDGIDREYVGLGSSEVLVTEQHPVETLVTFEMVDGAPKFVSASLQHMSLSFDDVEVEPDWGD